MIRQCRAGLLLGRALFKHSWRWQASSASERALDYKPGQVIHGFTVNEVTPIPEFFLTAVKLSHENTGAKYLHLARDDSNNLFSVQFRTTPMDSTGVPHILEHTVLCGSQKYPCRDPFFKMLNRSLSTFMNAFTASDYTMYPFSSQNPKDFQNLLSVYLDAVFFPYLRELDFWQEGWRLEHENPTDSSSPLIFKGIVFNEMKGAFTDNESVYAQHLQRKLLPDHTYSVVSGGEPLDIPDLTWEQLKKFHSIHYHPSNARFFTYGNFPLEQHLKQMQEDALVKFGRIDPNTEVPAQKHWDASREYHITCGVDTFAPDPAKQTMISISFLTSEIADPFEVFTLSLLSSLLVDGPNSPFYKALLEAKLGTDFSPETGFTSCTRDTYFSIGLQGIAEEDVNTVKEIITKTIGEVAQKGFEPERIEALLHKLEIQMKHQSTSFGLSLASYIGSSWNHDVDPVNMLKVGEKINRFRECVKENPNFLREKVKQYFQDNLHRMVLTMSPDEEYCKKQAELEREKLNQKVEALSEEDRKRVYEKGLELLCLQSEPQDVSCLPALKVSDIEPTIPHTEVELAYAGEVPIQYCAQPTNGMVYFRAVSSLNTLPEELKPYVPLFCSVVTKMGCGVYNYREQAQQMELTTGGMIVCPHIVPDDSNLDIYEQSVLFSSSCLDRNTPDMMHLWSEIFSSPHFDDEERLRVLVKMIAQDMSNGIPDSGHLYAQVRASRTLTPAGELQEIFKGMDQVKTMKRIADMSDLGPVMRKLSRIRKFLLLSDSIRCSLNATPRQISAASKEVERFLAGIPRNKKELKTIRPIVEKPLNPPSGANEVSVKGSKKLVCDRTFKPCQMKTHFSLPFPVNYISECVRTVPYSHPDYARLRVLARIMTAKFLHGEIREKGGAYGGGAKLNFDGVFAFYSYRDPNSLTTLSRFDKAIDWAKSGNFNQQDVDEAKLSVFSAVDSPIAPSDKGMTLFLSGISDEMRQTHREQLFAVSHTDLVNVASKYLTVRQSTRGAAILGPENPGIAKDPTWIIR
ncbi:presequence protease, mitochondrial isoform 1-T2 [Mantella aurantiaca]